MENRRHSGKTAGYRALTVHLMLEGCKHEIVRGRGDQQAS